MSKNKKHSANDKRKFTKVRISLRTKIVISMILTGILLTTGAILISCQTYWINTVDQYQKKATEIATTAASYFESADLLRYVDILKRKMKGEDTGKEIEAVNNDPEYAKLREMIEKLRVGMDANDIYVCAVDTDMLEKFTGADEDEDKKPLHYITDNYYKTDESFRFGDESSVVVEWAKLVREITLTGEINYDPKLTDTKFGYNLQQVYPIVRDGKPAGAIVGVEIPMDTINAEMRSFVYRILIVSAAILLLVTVAVILFLIRSVTSPIKLIAEEAGKFAQNDTNISDRLSMIRSRDEIRLLSENVLEMERNTNTYIKNLNEVTAEKERVSAELNVATRIQADMLPSVFPAFPGRTDFDLGASMTPAKEVGGDFYDFFLQDDDHLVIVMADVSGKGIPAALFMANAMTLIRSSCRSGMTSAEVLAKVNDLLSAHNREGLFVTVWLGILALSTGDLICTNAGHEYPVINAKGKGYQVFKMDNDAPLAAMENFPYAEQKLHLDPGDAIFLYTDGISEAKNAQGARYGMERLLDTLNGMPEEMSPMDMIKGIKADVDDFSGEMEQFDDLTMLLFKYHG